VLYTLNAGKLVSAIINVSHRFVRPLPIAGNRHSRPDREAKKGFPFPLNAGSGSRDERGRPGLPVTHEDIDLSICITGYQVGRK
jgi:hypothetical protein